MNRAEFRIWQCAVMMEAVDRLRFFTLTVPEHRLPLRVVADRWRCFVRTRWWRRMKGNRDYIVVYEPHPSGHGWHIHVLTNFFIPWQQLQLMANAVHFGHTDIEAADTGAALYIAKYVTKAQVLRRVQDSKHVRIVNVSRGLIPLRDIDVDSPSIRFIRVHWHDLDFLRVPASRRPSFLYQLWVYSWTSWVCSDFVELCVLSGCRIPLTGRLCGLVPRAGGGHIRIF